MLLDDPAPDRASACYTGFIPPNPFVSAESMPATLPVDMASRPRSKAFNSGNDRTLTHDFARILLVCLLGGLASQS